MSETQATIHQWMTETFPGTDPGSPRKSIRAMEEMVELCLASGATPEEIIRSTSGALHASGAKFHQIDGWSSFGVARPDKIPAEAADVLIVLYGLAGMRGFDLAEEVDRKMAINRSRQWAARGDGTGYHVKTGPESTPKE